MKKMFTLLLIVFSCLFVIACNNKKEAKSNSYVSVEINPSVEFVVDKDGKVVAANGTNDDGKTLILNVSFEGLDLTSAINIVLTEAEESGYLLSAKYNSELVSREINVSIDAEDADIQADINETISNTVNKFIEENDLAAIYKQLESKGRKHFEDIVKKYNPMITNEELDDLTYDDLLEMVELATIEKSQMANIALEEYYLAFKESEFKFAYKEEVAEKLSTINPILAAGYNAILNQIKTSIDVLNQLEYNIYVSEDSQYLQLLNQLNSYKDEVIKLNAQLAINENVTEITAEIKVKEDLINKITEDIETIMSTLRTSINSTRVQLNALYDSLDELEENITNIDFESLLTQVETDINSTKDGLCSSFETEFADEIASIKASVAARKDFLEGKTE